MQLTQKLIGTCLYQKCPWSNLSSWIIAIRSSISNNTKPHLRRTSSKMITKDLNHIQWQTIMYYAVQDGLITYSHTASGYDTYTATSKNLFSISQVQRQQIQVDQVTKRSVSIWNREWSNERQPEEMQEHYDIIIKERRRESKYCQTIHESMTNARSKTKTLKTKIIRVRKGFQTQDVIGS